MVSVGRRFVALLAARRAGGPNPSLAESNQFRYIATMRFFLPLLLIQILIIGIIGHVGAQHADPLGSPNPQPSRARRGAMKLASKLHPRMVSFLKEQADERKEFYNTESKLKNEFKSKQRQELQELLEKHRSARADFSKEKSSAEERSEFYRKQRDQMAKLRAEQNSDRKEFYSELKTKFNEFHGEQKQKRRELEEEIQKAK